MANKKDTYRDFVPDSDMVKYKQKLLIRLEENPAFSLSHITAEVAGEVLPSPNLKIWLKQTGFIEWLSNRSEAREKVAGLIDLALDRARRLLEDDRTSPSVQLGLIKTIFDVAAVKSKKEEGKDVTKQIEGMDKAAFDKFLASTGYIKLPTPVTPTIIDIEETEDEPR